MILIVQFQALDMFNLSWSQLNHNTEKLTYLALSPIWPCVCVCVCVCVGGWVWLPAKCHYLPFRPLNNNNHTTRTYHSVRPPLRSGKPFRPSFTFALVDVPVFFTWNGGQMLPEQSKREWGILKVKRNVNRVVRWMFSLGKWEHSRII